LSVRLKNSVITWQQIPPDIALLDMILPDGNGIDLLTYPPESNAFPMLILTSHGNEKAAVDALKAGALDYIVKSPETFAEMPRILTRNLNQWALIQENKKTEQTLAHRNKTSITRWTIH
jgi:DNA-binding NtrC family response regulator